MAAKNFLDLLKRILFAFPQLHLCFQLSLILPQDLSFSRFPSANLNRNKMGWFVCVHFTLGKHVSLFISISELGLDQKLSTSGFTWVPGCISSLSEAHHQTFGSQFFEICFFFYPPLLAIPRSPTRGLEKVECTRLKQQMYWMWRLMYYLDAHYLQT